MFLILVGSYLFLGASAGPMNRLFDEFKRSFHRTYPSLAHEVAAFKAFSHHIQASWNARKQLHGEALWDNGEQGPNIRPEALSLRLGFTNFTDYVHCDNSLTKMPPRLLVKSLFLSDYDQPDLSVSIQKKIDWYTGKTHGPAHDQGQCGCCYAMASVTVVETAHSLRTKKVINLSPQELLGCQEREPNRGGCSGGYLHESMNYFMSKGVSFLKDYPYTAKDTGCDQNLSSQNKKYKIKAFKNYYKGMGSLLRAMALGPVLVQPLAPTLFYTYQGNIIPASSCSDNIGPHAMVLISYDITNANNSTLFLKNSWAPSWGENGYVWMSFTYDEADVNGPCSIAEYNFIVPELNDSIKKKRSPKKKKKHKKRSKKKNKRKPKKNKRKPTKSKDK